MRKAFYQLPQGIRGLLLSISTLSVFAGAHPSHVQDSLGAVASESKLCSEIGIELLKQGGNAADALVGTTLCVGVIGMQHSGIGGGGFMLVRDKHGKFESIDFREKAPAAAYEDMYKHDPLTSVRGGLSSGVPGDVKGLEYLHSKYGKLPWRVVCNPAVYVARHGFPVTEDLVVYMGYEVELGDNFLTNDPVWAEDFAPNGTLVKKDDIMTRKRYANTLEQIAIYGSKAFYEGEIANYTIAALRKEKGIMTLDDLKDYEVSIRETVSIDYRGYKLYSVGTPSSGSVALNMLKIIECYNMSDPALRDVNTHRLDEAMRYAYAARGKLGDPDFFDDMEDFEKKMLSDKTIAKIRSKILDDRTRDPHEYNPSGWIQPDSHGTSHVVATDASGLSITLTSTVNLLFGSHLMVPETGVIMNNEMDDFSIPHRRNAFGFIPSPTNFIRPQKRPLSSITPVIALHPNGTIYVVIGAAGGSRIPTATVLSLWHVLDHGMNLPEALKEPRFHDQLFPAETMFEEGFDKKTVKSMKKRGHNITWAGGHQSAVQGVRRLWNGTFEAAGEPRQINSGGLAV